jgi:hypothetical protein
MLWYSVLIQCAFVGTKAEPSACDMKTKILVGLLVAATLAVAPGVAMAHGGGRAFHGGRGFHAGRGFHDGFAHHGFVSDRSIHVGRGFRHGHDRFRGHHFAVGNPWPWYYGPTTIVPLAITVH